MSLLLLLGGSIIMVPVGYTAWALYNSKLTSFSRPEIGFRIGYALYNSPLGQLIHDKSLSDYVESGKRPHTVECDAEDLSTFMYDSDDLLVAHVPYLQDNYAYVLVHKASGEVAVVDPADADSVMNFIVSLRRSEAVRNVVAGEIKLTKVLTTHKHMDHAGGNKSLVERVENELQVVGGKKDQVSCATVALSHEESVFLSDVEIIALETPCHTVGHISYYIKPRGDSPGLVFTGDTLFIGGVGKFFEGNAVSMHRSLSIIAGLPPSTLVFCGHEYTVAALEFGRLADPYNKALRNKLHWATKQRKSRKPTVPSTLSEELEYNVFLQGDNQKLQEFLDVKTEVGVLKKLRRWKDLDTMTPPMDSKI